MKLTTKSTSKTFKIWKKSLKQINSENLTKFGNHKCKGDFIRDK